MKRLLHALLLLGGALAANGTTIDSTDKFAYSQSAGWMNWRPDQAPGGEGVSVTQYHLRGMGYAQSTGWVDFGDGTPVDGLRYSNTSAADCGVNVDVFSNLSGHAYAQSIGWINFGWASTSDPNRPRFNVLSGQFSGYAYAQSVGWINLGAAFAGYFSPELPPDTDGDGLPDAWEIALAGNLTTLNAASDTDGDGMADRSEFQYFRDLTISDGTGDTDSDGFTDADEIAQGYNPTDPFSYPPPPPPLGTTIAFSYNYAWGQSTGWINCRHERPSFGSGVIVRDMHLKGHAWAQNVGWIGFGNGAPANGWRYANTTAAEQGVNLEPNGDLTGFAYGQSCGWINLGWAPPTSPHRARVNLDTGFLEGFAYGQSIGWINLAATGLRTDFLERIDTDFDGLSDTWEMLRLGSLETASFLTDLDDDGVNDFREYFADTDPLDNTSYLQATPIKLANTFQLTFPSSPARRYTIESSSDLIIWETLDPLNFAPDEGASTTKLVPLLPGKMREFYRVSVSLPLSGFGGIGP